MLALKDISRLFVIEGLYVPLNQGRIFAVVFRMATHTLLTGSRFQVIRSVQASPRRNAGRNLAVTIDTLEFGFAGRQLMTGSAVGCAIERLMGASKRPGRNLSRYRV